MSALKTPATILGTALVVAGAYKYYLSKTNDGVTVTLPTWAKAYEQELSETVFTTDEEMMAVAVELSHRNVVEKTGGPFGCAIFETDITTGKSKLFSIGMNRVTTLNNSTLHGEMVAIQFAQQKLQSFALKEADKEYVLCTSCEPCAMCLGGTFWSGVSRLICAATKANAEAIGFDEGPVFPESYTALEKAGIRVRKEVLQAEGNKVLQLYAKTGVIYNGKD